MSIKTATHDIETKCHIEKRPIELSKINHKMYIPCTLCNANFRILNTILKPCEHITCSYCGL